MSVIINGNTYTSGVSNVEDEFGELSPSCSELAIQSEENYYKLVDTFEVSNGYTNFGGQYISIIDFDVLNLDSTQKIKVINATRINHDSAPVGIEPYIALSKDKIYWVDGSEYDFNTITTTGNAYIYDSVLSEEAPLLLQATIEVYKLTNKELSYTDCNGASQKLTVERQKLQRSLTYKDAPNGNIVVVPPIYSEIDSEILVPPAVFTCNGMIESYDTLDRVYEDYTSVGFVFYYEEGETPIFDIKIEGIDGYCDFELQLLDGTFVGVYSSVTPPQTGFELFDMYIPSSYFNQYLKIVVKTGGAGCASMYPTPTKMTLIQKNKGEFEYGCCECDAFEDFCGNETVIVEFKNSCSEDVILKIKGKLQGGVYKFLGDEFTTYSGERIRPTTNIEAQYTLVIFEYSDAFFLAIQDLIANNLTMKIGGYDYYFFTNDITPTWDNFSEYGFASITLTRKDTIKKYRRNCCN
jgi:hypothetical protein